MPSWHPVPYGDRREGTRYRVREKSIGVLCGTATQSFRAHRRGVRATCGSVPGSGVSDGGVSVPDVRGPSRESLW
ncbi:hypothetical protein CKJ55_16385 [Mycobacterium avium]|nr:hypothetical protein CKJ55_16385 [Mycobacterium avium]PBA83800.1 hypothetical protein CKJ71_17395 [Mycobacterium avium]